MLVIRDRVDERLAERVLRRRIRGRLIRSLGIESNEGLAHAPAVVAALHHDVQFLVERLPHIDGEQFPRAAAVEGDSPRIAPAPRINFLPPLHAVSKRIVPGNAVGLALVHVEAQDFPEQHLGILAIAGIGMAHLIVVGAAAVAHADVEETIRPERQSAAVVIGLRLVDRQQHALRSGIDLREILRHHLELREVAGVVPLLRRSLALGRAVIDVELAVLFELGMQRQTEQTTLIESVVQLRQLRAHIEEQLLREFPILAQHMHGADLISDQKPPRSIVERDQIQRRDQALRDQFERDGGFPVGGVKVDGNEQRQRGATESGEVFRIHGARFYRRLRRAQGLNARPATFPRLSCAGQSRQTFP